MARQKTASRQAAQPAVKKKWTGLRGAAKSSSRKPIKSKGRGATAAKTTSTETTAAAISSLLAKIAVGIVRPARSFSAASSPER